MKTLFVTAASAIIGIISFASAAQAETQAFANPKVSGQRLDLCLEWEPVAASLPPTPGA